jgi:hypothetical protein
VYQGSKLKLELQSLYFRIDRQRRKVPVLVLGLNLGAGNRNASIYTFNSKERMEENRQNLY